MQIIKRGLQFVAALSIVVIACMSVWSYLVTVANMRLSDSEATAWENRLQGIRQALVDLRYTRGDIGYMPAGVLQGKPKTGRDDVDWVEARYTLIPFTLKQNSIDAPFVIVNYPGEPEPPKIPE